MKTTAAWSFLPGTRTAAGHPVPVKLTVHDWGESWTRYLTIPRPAAGALRAAFDLTRPVTGESSYSPTGRAFWGMPWVIRRRRFVVIQQSGGLDV